LGPDKHFQSPSDAVLTKSNSSSFNANFKQQSNNNMFANIPHIASTQDALASIEAMRMQEETGYRTEDYMQQSEPELPSSNGPQQPVDRECRSKMAEWCFQVVDFCKFNRETVSIAMSYLDRFLMTPAGLEAIMDRKIFQLAAMTSLYTAIKVHEPEAMEPKVVASLSRGAYTEDEVTKMERRILMAIQWRMNPPTAMSFVHHYMTLTTEGSMSESEMVGTLELAKFQTELAVNAYDFVGVNASTVAFAALSNALQCAEVNRGVEYEFLTRISQATGIDADSDNMLSVQDQLYDAVQNASMGCTSGNLRPMTSSKGMESSNSSIHYSPRSVSAATN
jgi:hypothetical protein